MLPAIGGWVKGDFSQFFLDPFGQGGEGFGAEGLGASVLGLSVPVWGRGGCWRGVGRRHFLFLLFEFTKTQLIFFNEKFTELCYTLRWWEETIQSEEKPVKARGWRPKWVLLIWLGFLRLPVGFLQTFFSATMMEQARLKPKPLAKVFFPTWTLDIIEQFQLFLVRQ